MPSSLELCSSSASLWCTPSYDGLRIFGCLCYPSTTSTTPHKLAPRSVACIFLGYPPNTKGYRCYDPVSHRVFTSRHVYFDEMVFPFQQQVPLVVSSPPATGGSSTTSSGGRSRLARGPPPGFGGPRALLPAPTSSAGAAGAPPSPAAPDLGAAGSGAAGSVASSAASTLAPSPAASPAPSSAASPAASP